MQRFWQYSIFFHDSQKKSAKKCLFFAFSVQTEKIHSEKNRKKPEKRIRNDLFSGICSNRETDQ
jgi:hypothetical protein